MKHPYAVFLFITALAGATDPAAAANEYWSSIATACTPDSLSIQNNRYQTPTDSYVAPQAANVDPIVLICGVSPNTGGTAPTRLSMTYLDATGTTATAAVKASLVRVARTTGGRAVVATVSSNSFAAVSVAKNSVTFVHALNFAANYYYVRIDMDRSAANQNLRSIGVALEP
jgi:hypothetical protein